MKKWVVFFSQTGKELADIIDALEISPSSIFYNQNSLEKVDERLKNRVSLIPSSPSEDLYRSLLKGADLITLHGYLRIVPSTICDEFEIYNGHPGLITEYPELKGKDPQEKAFNLKLDYSGSVIHRVTSEVDAGEIIKSKKVLIKSFKLEDVFFILREASLDIWLGFLKERLC